MIASSLQPAPLPLAYAIVFKAARLPSKPRNFPREGAYR